MSEPSEIVYLSLDDLLSLGQAVLGSDMAVRDYGLLESALVRPRATVFGVDAYPDLLHKAAALVESLAGNHALVDGNKRIAYAALRLFLLYNDVDLIATEDERYELMLAIADGSLRGVDTIAERLQTLSRRV